MDGNSAIKMTKYQQLLEQMELKGIEPYKQHLLLSMWGFQIFVLDPTPNGQARNEVYKRWNEEALDRALVEINYMV